MRVRTLPAKGRRKNNFTRLGGDSYSSTLGRTSCASVRSAWRCSGGCVMRATHHDRPRLESRS